MNEYYHLYKKHKICPNCQKQDAYTLAGRALCCDCAEKDRKRKQAERTSLEYREKHNERNKKTREKWIELGLCSKCGRKKTDNRYKTCGFCRAKSKEDWIKKVAATNQNYPRGENGFCWDCNKEKALDGKRLCRACYERQLPIALKSLEYTKGKSYFSKGFVYGKNAN